MDGQAIRLRSRSKQRKQKREASKLSRHRKPDELSLEAWQIELRRQFGREQPFQLKNLGDEPIFSEFEITNPASKRSYRVAIRGREPGDNFCSCPDFATNTLGTCKHIEFALAALARKRGGKEALGGRFQPQYSELFLHYGSRREVRFRPGEECPVELARLAGRYFDSDGVLLAEAFARFDEFLAKAARVEHELRCQEDALRFVAEVRDAEQRRQRVAAAFPRGIHSKALDKLVKASLYDYQREGALFAARAGRCLIGDEMGLGKTIQALAATEIMASLHGVERVLVVCPTSLKHQWEREIARFVDRSVQVIGGLRQRRQQQFSADSFYKIANYDTVYRDLDLIQSWSPDLVILDEAQRIKNWSTRTARSVKQIVSPYAIVLTGTPLENRLEELVSIVQFIDLFRLGPTFKLLHEHQLRDEVGKVVGYRQLDKIGKTLEPILLRRHKSEVLSQLPERLDKTFFVPMTPQQQKYHQENALTVAQIVQKWRRYGFLREADQRRLMIALQNMRMSCDSTYLLDKSSDFGVKADELATLLEEVYERPKTKVVIFSQWLRMHELVVRRFRQREWSHVLFHGGVPGMKRKDLIDRFREDPECRAFLATDAGGVGLNLQFASVVVNLDIPWNPAVLEQRVGRVHRLGQRQPVQVVNFVAQGTIEEGMLSVLQFKKSLASGILDDGAKEVFLGGSRLQRFMETVEKATTALPPMAVEDAAEAREARARNAKPVGDDDDEPPQTTPAPAAAASPAPWAGLVQTGLQFLESLVQAAQPQRGRPEGRPTSAAPGLQLLARDERTGEPYLKLPVPSPAVLEQAVDAFRKLLDGFRA